jgi:hypothetical protein
MVEMGFFISALQSWDLQIMYNNHEHPSCLNNLKVNLSEFDIELDDIQHSTFLWTVEFDEKGKNKVLPPTFIAGDHVKFKSRDGFNSLLNRVFPAEDSNGGTFKPIHHGNKFK